MATWGKAFTAAGKVVLYSIGWWIIGFIIFGIGAAMGISSGMPGPFGSSYSSPYGSYGSPMSGATSILGFIITLIGTAIIALGSVASFFKVFSEFLKSEIQ